MAALRKGQFNYLRTFVDVFGRLQSCVMLRSSQEGVLVAMNCETVSAAKPRPPRMPKILRKFIVRTRETCKTA